MTDKGQCSGLDAQRIGRAGKCVARVFLCAVLAWSMMVPVVPAFADDATSGGTGVSVAGDADAASGTAVTLDLEPGTYIEHEAIAYVIDADDAAQTFSLEASVLDGAETLMEVGAQAAVEALSEDVEAFGGASGEDTNATGSHAGTTEREDVAEKGSEDVSAFSLDEESAGGQLVLVHNDSLTTEQLIAELEADPRVVFAEPNALVEVSDDEVQSAGDVGASGASDASTTAVTAAGDVTASGATNTTATNTTYANLEAFQWSFANDGHMDGISPSETSDTEYTDWNNSDAAKGMDEVIVAVVDSGVDEMNPDLTNVMWRDGLDYHDLLTTGKEDACGFYPDASPGVTSTTGLDSGHGTHVAGIIGASWDDQGISGIAPNVKIMSTRFSGSTASVLACYDYIARACEQGVNVQVANNSWVSSYGAWRCVNLALMELGQHGVVSVFAAGNSAYDNDRASSSALQYSDNPYVVEVNSYGSSGNISEFSQYGLTTTDIMAPGSAVLSTFPMAQACYLGEADADATLYESFDSASHTAAGATGKSITFATGTVAEGACFDGTASFCLPYDASTVGPYTQYYIDAFSNFLSLADIAEKPEYLSIRYKAVADDGSTAIMPSVSVSVRVMEEDGASGWAYLKPLELFGTGNAWSGYYAEFPDNVDWENFQIVVSYMIYDYALSGGVEELGDYRDGTLLVDSIGLGSARVPYAYSDGTSMACPAVVGVAAVLAGQGKAQVAGDDKAKSAEKLAAVVKSAAVPTKEFDALCSTGGYATVDGADSPGPAITRVVDAGDSVSIEGYFMDASSAVTLGGMAAHITACEDLGDGKVRLSVEKPDAFEGGQAVVCVQATAGTAAGKKARESVNFGEVTDVLYFDQTDLPIPDELNEWGLWSLVGFNGYLYCLPHNNSDLTAPTTYMLRYDTQQKSWSKVDLPLDLLQKAGFTQGCDINISGTTIGGALVLQCVETDEGTTTFLRYTADGAWESTGYTFVCADGETEPYCATLAGDGEHAYLFGGTCGDENGGFDNTIIYRVDFGARELVAAGTLEGAGENPLVTYSAGVFVVSGGYRGNDENSVQGALLVTQSDGMWTSEPIDFSAFTANPTGGLAYASGMTAGGFMLAGPVSDDGTADTYLLNVGATTAEASAAGTEASAAAAAAIVGEVAAAAATGEAAAAAAGEATATSATTSAASTSTLTAYSKRASQLSLVTPTALGYRGQFYVLATTQDAPYCVFSSTAVETGEQPGDASDTPGPSPAPDPSPSPEPDSNSGVKDTTGTNSSTPKTLARTGDALSVLPLVVLAAGAMCSVCVSACVIRRRGGSR